MPLNGTLDCCYLHDVPVSPQANQGCSVAPDPASNVARDHKLPHYLFPCQRQLHTPPPPPIVERCFGRVRLYLSRGVALSQEEEEKGFLLAWTAVTATYTNQPRALHARPRGFHSYLPSRIDGMEGNFIDVNLTA